MLLLAGAVATEAREASGARPSPRLRWTTLVKLAVSIGLLVVVLRVVDRGRLGAALADVDPLPLAASGLLYLGGQALSAVKWKMLAKAAGLDEPLGRFVRHYFVGMFFNVFGLGTVGGDVVRGLALAARSGRRTLALNTVVADRVSGLLVLLAIALASLLLFRTYELPAIVYWTTVSLSAGLLGGWRLAPRLLPLVLAPDNWFRRLVEKDLAPYWNDYRLLWRVSVVSAIFHVSQIGVIALLARSLHLEVPASYFFIFCPLVNVFAALPISINGLGVREGTTVYFLTHVGVAVETATALALLSSGLVVLSGLVGGLVYLRSPSDEATTTAADHALGAEDSTPR